VAARTDEPVRSAVRIAKTAATHLKPTPLTIRLTHAVFAFIARRTAFEMLLQLGVHVQGVVGVNDGSRSPRGARGGRDVGALTLEGLHLWGKKQLIGGEVPVPMPLVRAFHCQRISLSHPRGAARQYFIDALGRHTGTVGTVPAGRILQQKIDSLKGPRRLF